MENKKNNLEELIKKINNCIKNFSEKLERLNFNNIDEEIIKNIIIKTKNKTTNIGELCNITDDGNGNLIIEIIEKNEKKIIEEKIKNSIEGSNITKFKNFIKIKKNLITEEEIKKTIKILEKEKEKSKIIIRNLRRKEISKNNNNEKEIEKLITKKIQEIEKIFENKIKNIR